jgi:hypothetical protein
MPQSPPNVTNPRKQRTRYKHSGYVCDKCRQAHRRCKHDPTLDPNYDPNKPRKRKRAPETAVVAATAAEQGQVDEQRDEHASAHFAMAEEEYAESVIEFPAAPSASILQDPLDHQHELTLTMLFNAFCVYDRPAQYWGAEWRPMLSESAALRTASLALAILQSPLYPERRAEAMEYKQAAVTMQLMDSGHGNVVYKRGTPLLINMLLSLCEFASQSPFEAFALHAVQRRAFMDRYIMHDALPPVVAGIMLSSSKVSFPVSKQLVDQYPSVAEPFFFIFSGISMYDGWAFGNVQDLMSMTLSAYDTAQRDPVFLGSAARRLAFRLYLYVAQGEPQPSPQQRFVDLITESLYVLTILLEFRQRPIPPYFRMNLCAKIELVEHLFGTMGFTRMVINMIDTHRIGR